MSKISFPTTVDIALTGRCNLRCKHCNTSETWQAGNELTFEETIKVFDELKENKIFHLNLFGGEPFYHPRIYDLLKKLNDYPFRITILTNGTLIDGTTIEYLKEMRFLDTVQVSIDGSTSEIHDWQRGTGSFDRAIKSVEMLIANGISTTIKAIINAHNYKDIEDMVKLALKLGLEGMDFGDAVECGRAAVYANDLQFEGEVQTVFLVPANTRSNIFDAMRNGRMYATRGTEEYTLQLDSFAVEYSGKEATMGEDLKVAGPVTVAFKVSWKGKADEKITAKLIRSGIIVKEFVIDSPGEYKFEDDFYLKGYKMYYRLDIRGKYPNMLFSNPIFVTFTEREDV